MRRSIPSRGWYPNLQPHLQHEGLNNIRSAKGKKTDSPTFLLDSTNRITALLLPLCDSPSPSPTPTSLGAAFDDSIENDHEFEVHLEAEQLPSGRSNTRVEAASTSRIGSTINDTNFCEGGNNIELDIIALDPQTVSGVRDDLSQAPVSSQQLEGNSEEVLNRTRSPASNLQVALSNAPGSLEQSLLQYCKC
jgi:hypothetical protein